MLTETPSHTSAVSALHYAPARIQLDVVIPVYNEERDLRYSVLRLHRHLMSTMSDIDWRITIVDNASVDGTPAVATLLTRQLPRARYLRLERKGRGHALRTAWGASEADVVAYMDVDLSTDLGHLRPLVAPLLGDEADVAFGSRLSRDSDVTRGFKREFISRTYNRILRATLAVGFSDAQCGFKAARRSAVVRLLPQIQDENWFFDTELLVLAEREKMTLHEVPVRWHDDPDSRVNIIATAIEDLRGVRRLRRSATSRTARSTIEVAAHTS